MPIVSATGTAAAASPNRSRSFFAREMERAMTDAIKQAALDGVVNPDEIRARISAARIAVKARYRET